MRRLGVAEQRLQSLGVTAPGDIDVEAIAWIAGAKVRLAALESCEARIIGVRDKAIITVRASSSPARRRFSIAHELGHWQHHRGRSSVCRTDEIGGGGRSSAAERQADVYAADLLMPAFLFEPAAARHPRPSFEIIEELAQEFSTSRMATAMRFVDLGGCPCMLICHDQHRRRWFRSSPDWPSRWFPRNDWDSGSSAMDVLHGSRERSRSETIGADAWFDRQEAERFTIWEQSIRSFGDQVLTLLTITDERMLN